MNSETNKRDLYLSPDIVYSVMIVVLFIILVIQIYTYFNFKYQINKLSLLFGDFSRFYIHTSKPPCRDLTNFDLLNYVNDKDSSKSTTSTGSKSSQCENLNKIEVINENNGTMKNFRSKFRKLKNPSTPASSAKQSNSHNLTPFPLVNLNQFPNYKQINQRRHSTFDLTNRLKEDVSNEKLHSQCSKYKFRHSESYSFDLANKIYSHISANESKTNGNKFQMMPQRRPRLYGISDDCSNGKRYLHSVTSTSTPNK